jgi:ABC-2 type transport system permease protein
LSSTADAGLKLREVKGPSAFGTTWGRFWDLLWLTAVTEFKLRYLHSVLGYAWTLLRPLLFFGVVFVVLRQILRFGEGIPNYAAMLLLNIMLFQYFQETTTRAVRSVTSREGLVRKMQFPRIAIPVSVSLTGALTLCLNLVTGFALILVLGVEPRPSWLLLPVVLVLLVMFTTAIAMILSVLYIRFRDVAQVWSVVSRVLFYATPILYPIEIVPDEFRPIVAANPLAPLFELARVWVVDPTAPGPVEAAGGALMLLIPIALFIVICVFALWIFAREAPHVAEVL